MKIGSHKKVLLQENLLGLCGLNFYGEFVSSNCVRFISSVYLFIVYKAVVWMPGLFLSVIKFIRNYYFFRFAAKRFRSKSSVNITAETGGKPKSDFSFIKGKTTYIFVSSSYVLSLYTLPVCFAFLVFSFKFYVVVYDLRCHLRFTLSFTFLHLRFLLSFKFYVVIYFSRCRLRFTLSFRFYVSFYVFLFPS